ncbi:ankyrin repeat-containing domain protein [Schizothecium vesticola]|uniref:Ankyrin repeat-containing domain protein n=1 Tax=Schizothecium vesticola TaxID=314040 RepID=A0AA40KB91_9PEZI|nr:ankyrin repeat-containing domain protein [Schizothecium vesticola]
MDTCWLNLYLLANNYHEAPIDQPNQNPAEVMATQDNRIVNLLDRVCRINADHLTSFLSSPDPITEAIRDSAFASALRVHCPGHLRHIASTGVDLDGRIRTQNQSMKTPLQFAAEVQDEDVSVEMIQILLDLGARPSLPLHPETLSPLYCCIKKKHYHAAALLLERSAGVGPRHLMLAIEQSIDYDANPNGYPLSHNPSKLVTIFLRSGAGINERLTSTSFIQVDVTPLGFAVMKGNGALAERLLDLGADLNAHQTTQCIRLLPGLAMPDHAICRRSVTTTCLGLAAHRGEIEVVHLLLSKGTGRLDTLPVEGYRSPLLIACVQGQCRIAIALIKKGVHVPISNENAKGMECVPVSLTLDAALRFALNPSEAMSIDSQMLRRLLSHYATDTSTGGGFPVSHRGPRTTLLKQAIEAGIAQDVQQYIEAGTSMPLVVRQIGNYKVALVLERYGVLSKLMERNCPGVLLEAIRARQYEVVSTVLQSGIAHHDDKGKCFDAAVSTGNVGLITELFHYKANFTPKTFPLAVRCQSPVEVLLLLLSRMPQNWTRSSDRRESVTGKESLSTRNWPRQVQLTPWLLRWRYKGLICWN